MKRTVLLYGLSLATVVFVLKQIEYRFLVKDLRLEFYIGTVALVFTVVGVWAGTRIVSRRPRVIPKGEAFAPDDDNLQRTGLSKRELEVLDLMASGLSNQEIANRLFVSLNTVKTHTTNVFLKLDVRRRTQAIQKGKELRLIP